MRFGKERYIKQTTPGIAADKGAPREAVTHWTGNDTVGRARSRDFYFAVPV